MPETQRVPLQELVHLVTDKILLGKESTLPYVGLEHMESGSPDLRGHAMASDSISTNCIFAAGDTLFGKLRPNLRKVVIAPLTAIARQISLCCALPQRASRVLSHA